MTGTKTVAERLREKHANLTGDDCWVFPEAVGKKCGDFKDCQTCVEYVLNALADMIEAEQASAVSKTIKGAKPQLPEGVIWPTYEDGELVRFGDVARVREDIGDVIEVRFHTGKCSEVTIAFEGESTATHYMVVDGPHLKRHEPEVLDADGVPIRVGDTVYLLGSGKEGIVERVGRGLNVKYGYRDVSVRWPGCTAPYLEQGEFLTHRKPDTQEAIEKDCGMEAYDYLNKRGICPSKEDYDSQKAWKRDCRRLQKLDLLERQRKLLGGE